jgi:hypothetical protein
MKISHSFNLKKKSIHNKRGGVMPDSIIEELRNSKESETSPFNHMRRSVSLKLEQPGAF